MVDGDVLVTTLPSACVSLLYAFLLGSCGLFRLANERAFMDEEP